MRRVILGIVVLILVLIAGAVIFAATFDVNKYRGTIQTQLEKRLGRPVTLGDMHLGVFPPRFRVQDVSIADDPHFSPDAPFIKARELDVSVKLMPLLHKQIEVDSLHLDQPSVNLIKNPAGVWNFASLGHPGQAGAAPESASNNGANQPASQPAKTPQNGPQSRPQANSEQQFSLAKLTIVNGQLSFLDQKQSKTPSIYDHIDVTLTDFAPNQPFNVDAAVHMAGTGSESVRLQGKGGPVVQNDPVRTPFHGTLNLKQVNIADLSKFLNSPALNGTNGTVNGQIQINSDNGKVTANGDTNIQNAKVRGMELGYPISAQYDLTDDLSADLITLRKFTAKLGNTPFDMNGTINVKPTPAQLDLNVRANNISIAELSKLLAASGMALSQGTNVTGNLNANIQARGSAAKPALNGTVTASNVQMSGKDIAKPIQIQSVNLNLTPAEIRSNPFTVVSDGTSLNAQFSARNYTSPSPLVDATVRAPNAQLPAILALAKAYGVSGVDKLNGAGLLNLDMHASGPVKSLSSQSIMKALNGTMNVNFNNVKYSGANISQQLASIAGFLNPGSASQSAQGITDILKLTGNIVVRNGIAQTNDLQAQLDIGNIGIAGTADLASEALNLRATAVLSQGVSQKVGGQNIGGFMKTALANNKGELVVPALITGTFSNPRFSPDVQQLAQMKLKGLVPNINNPASVAGALQNLLGGMKAPAGQQPSQDQQQSEQNQQQNPLQEALGGLFGKKKQQQTAPPPQK